MLKQASTIVIATIIALMQSGCANQSVDTKAANTAMTAVTTTTDVATVYAEIGNIPALLSQHNFTQPQRSAILAVHDSALGIVDEIQNLSKASGSDYVLAVTGLDVRITEFQSNYQTAYDVIHDSPQMSADLAVRFRQFNRSANRLINQLNQLKSKVDAGGNIEATVNLMLLAMRFSKVSD